jgi:hypothetical protein
MLERDFSLVPGSWVKHARGTLNKKDLWCDEVVGYWISRKQVIPIAETKIDNILAASLKHDVELRIMPSLWKLREAVMNSTLAYSIIRMHKAQPPRKESRLTIPCPSLERRAQPRTTRQKKLPEFCQEDCNSGLYGLP